MHADEPHAAGWRAGLQGPGGKAHAHGAPRTARLSLRGVARGRLTLPGGRSRSPHPGWSSSVAWSGSWRRVSERRRSRRRSSERGAGGPGSQAGDLKEGSGRGRTRPGPGPVAGSFWGPCSPQSPGAVRGPVLSPGFTSFPKLESPSRAEGLHKRKLPLRDAFLGVWLENRSQGERCSLTAG